MYPAPNQFISTAEEVSAALLSDTPEVLVSESLDLIELRNLACLDHRLIMHQYRITTAGIPPSGLESVNYFTDVDTDEDPDRSQYYMAVLLRFVVEYDEADEEKRGQMKDAILLALRTSVKVNLVEEEQARRILKEQADRQLGKTAVQSD